MSRRLRRGAANAVQRLALLDVGPANCPADLRCESAIPVHMVVYLVLDALAQFGEYANRFLYYRILQIKTLEKHDCFRIRILRVVQGRLFIHVCVARGVPCHQS